MNSSRDSHPLLVPILLAAGRGSRVGGNKGLLRVLGECLIERHLRILVDAGLPTPVVVTGSEGLELESIAAHAGAHVVPNVNWQNGQTSSIRAGIMGLPPQTKGFFLMPVDYAAVTAEDWTELQRAFIAQPLDSRPILRPFYGARGGHPVLFHQEYAAAFQSLSNDEPGNVVYRSHLEHVIQVPVRNPHIGLDVDTREDLALLTEILMSRSDGPPSTRSERTD
jgi:CTP:molybdopterin cytidylyltransferase MocA